MEGKQAALEEIKKTAGNGFEEEKEVNEGLSINLKTTIFHRPA